jgi:predicted transcriptional regulator
MNNPKGAGAPKFNRQQSELLQEKWDGTERRRQVRESQSIGYLERALWITLGAVNILAIVAIVFCTAKLI